MRPRFPFEHRPKRHPDNPDLPLLYENRYEGMRVYQHALGPLIEPYLKRSLHILNKTQAQARTFVCRLDLRFPEAYPLYKFDTKNTMLETFWRHLRRELKAAATTHPTYLSYLWAREQARSDKHHYHLMLLLNYEAICTLGDITPSVGGGYYRDNLFHRVARSWARAIEWPLEQMEGRVNASKDPITGELIRFILHKNDRETFEQVFHVASYLCKAYSKPIGQGGHCFGSSRL